MSIAEDILSGYIADRERLARLRGEHQALEARLTDLHARARGGEWDDLDPVWSDFVRDLEEHMSFEERELFDRLVDECPEYTDYVAKLREEHAEIRRALERLGIEIQLHLVRADTVDAALDALSRHAASEHRVFYPWLEEKLL